MLQKRRLSFFYKDFFKNCYVIDKSISKSDYLSIDLSQSNNALQTFDISLSKSWEIYLLNYLKKHNKKVAFGGYLEKRDLYRRSNYFSNLNTKTQRDIHLGIDIWAVSGTKVLAVLDGEIHSFKDNINFGDYGPTIILKHTIADVIFYSLYGHLSRESLINIKAGDRIKKGAVLANLGKAEVNGDYAPHLHFQIIIDLQGNIGDYPGVCNAQTLAFYKCNCPDPNSLLNLL